MFKYLKLFILLFIGLILKCVMMKIVDEGCNASQSCVAFRKDYFNLTAGNSLYKYHATYKNWNVAKEACAREGASLFYAESSDEAKAVTSFLKTHIRDKGLEDKGAWDPSKWIHVGIFRTSGTEFETIDGKPLSKVWHDWQTNEPNNVVNERCVQMNEDGKFNDVSCSYYESGFFCKKTLSLREQNLQKLCITNSKVSTLKMFVFWPNATVPFYINPDHFDEELQTAILKSLDTFAVKTCIKFIPVIVAPSEDQHVMTFINPKGLRRCKIEMKGHSNYNSHLIVLGYKCINTPQLDMIIMRALGLPFEHNRMSRDLYIDVLIENIEPSYLPLFTKECILPEALRKIPYDANSVMHFGERDYSKNGHKTIRFKKDAHRLDKKGLTDSDIKKIALVYGPECVARDRAEKVALCRTRYLSRRKREIEEPPANMSLRVNPNITPPPHKYT